MSKSVANLVFNSFINDIRVIKESRSLSNSGYRVEVIAHGDKDLPRSQKYENFIIKRFSYVDRSIPRSQFFKLKAYIAYIKECVKYCKEFDILQCNDLNTLPIAFIIKRFYNKKIKVIYDAHEYATEAIGVNPIERIILKTVEGFLIKYADRVITVSGSIADEYERLYKIKKPALVLNTPIYKDIEKKNLFREKFDIEKDTMIFLYQGVFDKGRGIEGVIESFKTLKDEKAVVVFMGSGVLEELIRESVKENENIYFQSAVAPEIILDYTSSADFGFATIEDSCLSYRYCLPNKMFEYLMVEIPVIVSNLPEMRKIVEENDIGVVIEENSREEIRNIIKILLKLDREKLKINIKKVKKIYNWNNQEEVLLKVYKEVE